MEMHSMKGQTMSRYHVATGEPVDPKPTKYDDCTVHATGRPYRMQEGSGRSTVISRFFQNGMRLGDIALTAALEGWESEFVVDCAFKQHTSKQNAWEVHPPEGTSLEAIKGARKDRELTPEAAAKREQAAAEKAEKAAARAAEKVARAAERERKAAEAKAVRDRERAEARRIVEENKAAAIAAAGEASSETSLDEEVKVSKSKRKAKVQPVDLVELEEANNI